MGKEYINETLGAAGSGVTVKLGEEEYTLTPSTYRAQGEYEKWLVKEADTAATDTASTFQLKCVPLYQRVQQIESLTVTPEGLRNLDELIKEQDHCRQTARMYEEMADRHLSKHDDKKASGHYKFGGRACYGTMSTEHGSAKFFQLLLKKCHPTITFEKALQLHQDFNEEVIKAINEVEGNKPKKEQSPKETPSADQNP